MSSDLRDTATGDLIQLLSASGSTQETGRIVAELVERHKAVAYRAALRHCRGNAAFADEIFQETFLRLFAWLRENGERLRPDGFPRLLSIFVKRAAIDLMRREFRQAPTASEQEAKNVPAAEDGTAAWETEADLLRLMADLPARSRLVLELSLQDMTALEIGELLGLTPTNVRILRHRAVASIRSRITNDGKKTSSGRNDGLE